MAIVGGKAGGGGNRIGGRGRNDMADLREIHGNCDVVATPSKEERTKGVGRNKGGQKSCLSNKNSNYERK